MDFCFVQYQAQGLMNLMNEQSNHSTTEVRTGYVLHTPGSVTPGYLSKASTGLGVLPAQAGDHKPQ